MPLPGWFSFYIISLIVVVPRVLLGLYAYAKARYIENHFPIDLESVYYSNILRQWRGQTMLIQIIPFSHPLTEKVKDEIQKFASERIQKTLAVFFLRPT